MPFTPFHLGPSFLIGMLFLSQLNMAAMLLSSIIIDIEPIYCIISHSCPIHGVLHTYVGVTALSLTGVTAAIYVTKKQLQRISDALGIKQTYSLRSIAIGALIGGWSHVFLDSFLYPELLPFWPILLTNPFVGIIDNDTIYLTTIIGFVGGALLYFWKLKTALKAKSGRANI
ncbi:MAG: hypothetical protein ACREBU_20475 [Nitrososphaera sp.]